MVWRPPCIRAVVKETNCLEPGALYIITIDGGVIGSEEACTIKLPAESAAAVSHMISF